MENYADAQFSVCNSLYTRQVTHHYIVKTSVHISYARHFVYVSECVCVWSIFGVDSVIHQGAGRMQYQGVLPII